MIKIFKKMIIIKNNLKILNYKDNILSIINNNKIIKIKSWKFNYKIILSKKAKKWFRLVKKVTLKMNHLKSNNMILIIFLKQIK